MRWIARLEPRLGWMSFPGFLRYYAILTALVFVLERFHENLLQLLNFDLQAILSGEVWRLFTFIFASSHYLDDWPAIVSILLMLIFVRLSFMISDGLEGAWGEFRTSLFYYFGIICLIIGNIIIPGGIMGSGIFVFICAFYSFAALYPKVELMMFFILPVQVRYLALIGFVMGVLRVIDVLMYSWIFALLLVVFYFVVCLNYLLWAGLPVLRGRAKIAQASQRRRKFETAKQPASMAFHECATCNRTDQTDPELEFRISQDGKEYCAEHLPEGGG